MHLFVWGDPFSVPGRGDTERGKRSPKHGVRGGGRLRIKSDEKQPPKTGQKTKKKKKTFPLEPKRGRRLVKEGDCDNEKKTLRRCSTHGGTSSEVLTRLLLDWVGKGNPGRKKKGAEKYGCERKERGSALENVWAGN